MVLTNISGLKVLLQILPNILGAWSTGPQLLLLMFVITIRTLVTFRPSLGIINRFHYSQRFLPLGALKNIMFSLLFPTFHTSPKILFVAWMNRFKNSFNIGKWNCSCVGGEWGEEGDTKFGNEDKCFKLCVFVEKGGVWRLLAGRREREGGIITIVLSHSSLFLSVSFLSIKQ